MGLPGQGVESPGDIWASHRGSEQRSEQGNLVSSDVPLEATLEVQT